MSALMIMAGGTGGHVFPALAVANKLRDKDVKVIWLGTHRGLEATVVPANGIAIEWISIEGLRGKGVISWLLAPFNLCRAMWQSARVIRKIQPDCVLGMGGFVAGPGGLVARIMGKPLVVHEQNAVAGLTNQYLAKIANRVLTGFPNVNNLPSNAVWVGNPVRETISEQLPAASDSEALRILVLGGSQGAHSFNQYLPKLFSEQTAKLSVWHQTGKGRDVDVAATYRALDIQAKVTEFIDDMASAYAWADLLVCRSGAMTVAECCAAGRPALFIPFPYSAGDHQTKNAMVMVDANAAMMVTNQELIEPANMNKTNIILTSLLADRTKLAQMGRVAKTLYKPDALQQVVKTCEEYLNA